MNRRVVFLVAFVAVLMMSLAAYAQDRPRQGGPGGRMGGFRMGSGWLLRNEAVQKELGVTEEQLKKLQEVFGAGPGAGGARPSEGATDEELRKFREEAEKRAAEQEKKFGEVLNEKQQARLKQIRYQVVGVMALSGEELAKELSITEEQAGKIRDVSQEMFQAMRDAQQDERAALREKMTAKVMEILTEEQKTKYKELLGEPFDVSQIRMGGPGGGGRRGGN